MKTFSGDTSPSLADLDGNFAELAELAVFSGPQNFGAKCDLALLMNPGISSGSNVLNCSDAAFTADDIGKAIAITGAGAAIGVSVADGATLYGPLVTTITGRNSATQVTLAATAGRTVGSGVGVQYIKDNATREGSAKAFYGTDDTAALQAYVDYVHPRDGIVKIPRPGCMVLGTVYCQTSRSTDSTGLLWRRLEFRGVGPAVRVTTTGLASTADSNLFKPTPGNILTVNLDAAGAGMTSTGAVFTHLFSSFNVNNLAFHGMPGVLTNGIKAHVTRADIEKTSFNNLRWGWDCIDADVNGAPNYCDQWRVDRVNFNNCAGFFRQAAPDATEWRSLVCESFYPTVTNAFEVFGGRGWEMRALLINNLPAAARIGQFTDCKEGSVRASHFEHIWGNAFRILGSNSKSWVDFYGCDFYHPLSAATAGVSEHTIHYTGAGGTVERCGFSHKRSATGYDIYFQTARYQHERNNHFYEADNITWRRQSAQVDIAAGGLYGSTGTSARQQYFVEIVWTGTNFDIRNVNGSSVLSSVMTSPPVIDGGGFLNLDGPRTWGRPTMAIAIHKNGKYRPVITDVYILRIAWYDAAGSLVTTPDANMNCYLLVS